MEDTQNDHKRTHECEDDIKKIKLKLRAEQDAAEERIQECEAEIERIKQRLTVEQEAAEDRIRELDSKIRWLQFQETVRKFTTEQKMAYDIATSESNGNVKLYLYGPPHGGRSTVVQAILQHFDFDEKKFDKSLKLYSFNDLQHSLLDAKDKGWCVLLTEFDYRSDPTFNKLFTSRIENIEPILLPRRFTSAIHMTPLNPFLMDNTTVLLSHPVLNDQDKLDFSDLPNVHSIYMPKLCTS